MTLKRAVGKAMSTLDSEKSMDAVREFVWARTAEIPIAAVAALPNTEAGERPRLVVDYFEEKLG